MDIEKLSIELNNLYEQKKAIVQRIKFLEKQLQDQTKSYIYLKDNIKINLEYLSSTLIDELKSLASFNNPQIQILQNLRKPIYNTPKTINSYEIIDDTMTLPRGLMRSVIELFKKYNLDTTYIDERYLKKELFLKLKYQVRDEQKKAIDAILKKDFCLCVAPPGFGKTFIGSKVIELRGVNTLVIVNKNMLLDQWCERFMDYFGYKKEDIGYLGKGKELLNNKLDIATMQSLKNNLEVIENYSFVIVDECHHIPALTFEKIIKSFKGKYILGLSATPNRKDGMEPLIYQQLGSIAYEVKSKRKVTNKLKIVETDFISEVDNFSDLINELINNEKRNNLILEEIMNYKERKILLLTDRIEHIENIELLLKLHNIKFISIHGSLNKQKQKENMEKIIDSSLVLATTSFFGEGIDFPHLDTIIFATPISYYGRVVQYLGRIGRGGGDCLAIDILDVQNRFALSSYKKRKEGYKQLYYTRLN